VVGMLEYILVMSKEAIFVFLSTLIPFRSFINWGGGNS
jgi:hypothetical protein